jgi:hypothetical protein
MNIMDGPRVLILAMAVLTFQITRAVAEPLTPTEQDDQATSKPTEIGIRFTPQMAEAMSKKFLSEMKPRYDLDDKQVAEISPIIQRQLMKFANENAVISRDMIELMMATSIEHDGRFPKEDAQQFAKLANQFTPKFKEFCTETTARVAQKMTVTQRLKYTADVGVFAAGLIVFENRMKRWEEGKVGDYAFPFIDPPGDEPAKTDPEPIDPREPEVHRKARKEVEASIGWQINKDDQWQEYLERCSKYYGFTAAQLTSANSILKDCKDRAAAIKTPQWKDAAKDIRIVRRLSLGISDDVSKGPWMVSLEEAFKKHTKPLDDLDAEFKRRLEGLPDSAQRAKARESVRATLAAKGVTQLPN